MADAARIDFARRNALRLLRRCLAVDASGGQVRSIPEISSGLHSGCSRRCAYIYVHIHLFIYSFNYLFIYTHTFVRSGSALEKPYLVHGWICVTGDEGFVSRHAFGRAEFLMTG